MNRYDPTLSSDPYQSHEYAVMEEEQTGEYVKYENYQILEAKIAELEKEIFKQSQESKEAVSRSIEIILEKDERIAELEESNKTLMQRATDLERELWLINQSKAGE